MHPFSDDVSDPAPVGRPASAPGHQGGHEPDPAVVEAVTSVRDRFGAGGLRDMIALARAELTVVEEALAQLTAPEPTGPAGEAPGPTP